MAADSDEFPSYMIPVTAVLGLIYLLGFGVAATEIFSKRRNPHGWRAPWVPRLLYTEALLMPLWPVALLAPAVLWPLTLLGAMVAAACRALGGATTCCGIPTARGGRAGGRDEEEGRGAVEMPELARAAAGSPSLSGVTAMGDEGASATK